MSDAYRHPDGTGGGVFLFLMIAGAAYTYFVIYGWAGNFKPCNEEQYPLQLVCLEEAS